MPHKPDTPCAGCGKLLWSSTTSAPAGERTCNGCRSAGLGPRPTVCAFCESEFVAKRVRKTWTRTCGKSCARKLELQQGTHPLAAYHKPHRTDEERRERWRRQNWKRRALKRSVPSESYTLEEIAERDSYRCGICRRKVNMAVAAPHSRSPSIDHIVPSVLGGDDTRANVQLAHRGCNSSKGARLGVGVQPRLVG